MTEVAVRNESAVEVGPRRLVEWAQEASAAHDLAAALCATSFCPQAFQGKPGEATAAILAGSEVGLSPLAALNAYDVIQGRPAPKAITLRALVQSAGHEIWLESATDRQVIMRGRRRGESNVQTSDWTIARASSLGLTNKQQWKQQPQTMLTARATSEIARLVGADVILGIPYSSEELADLEPTEPVATVKRATTAKRAAAPEIPEPEVLVERIDEAEVVEPVNRNARGVDESGPFVDKGAEPTKKQVGLMWALLGEKFPTEDEQREYLHLVIDREWTSTTEFSRGDVSKVIDSLGGAA